MYMRFTNIKNNFYKEVNAYRNRQHENTSQINTTRGGASRSLLLHKQVYVVSYIL